MNQNTIPMTELDLNTSQLHFIVTTLDEEDRPKIESHLLRLSKEDRYLRFFAALGDSQVKHYASTINLQKGKAFGVITLPERKLVALAHISEIEKSDSRIIAEMGISVDADVRIQGLGKRLMDRAVTYCQTHGINTLFMSCLRENKVMQKLAKDFDLRIVLDAGEAMAELDLDPLDKMKAMPKEMLYQQISLFDKAFKHNQMLIDAVLMLQ